MKEAPSLLGAFRGLVDGNLAFIGAIGLVYWVILAYYHGQTRKLKHIPTVGRDASIIPYLSSFKLLAGAQDVILTGIEKFPRRMFKVATLTKWIVIIHDPKVIDEVRRLPDSILSAHEALDDLLQAQYTLGIHIGEDEFNLPIVRTQLTQAIPQLVPSIYEELVVAFNDLIPATNDWTSIRGFEMVQRIVARTSNRAFVGLPLCRNTDYIDLVIHHATAVAKVAGILSTVPSIFRPMVNFLISNLPETLEHGVRHFAPLIATRRQAWEKGGDYPDKSLDMLSWLMDAEKKEEITNWHLTSRILLINFMSLHTTTMAFTHALFYLAAYPEYIKALRVEVEEVVQQYGWTKDALEQMHHVDSFIKESQRLNPLGILVSTRHLLKDHVFSDGTMVPRGTEISTAVPRIHLDGEIYEEPSRFDGFRFVKLKELDAAGEGVPEKTFDLVSTSRSLAFGLGRHACPGRFFAAAQMKMMLAHTVVMYDVKLENDGVRPPDQWFAFARIPNPTARVLFRRRAVD